VAGKILSVCQVKSGGFQLEDPWDLLKNLLKKCMEQAFSRDRVKIVPRGTTLFSMPGAAKMAR
jgi:hypothetical protein